MPHHAAQCSRQPSHVLHHSLAFPRTVAHPCASSSQICFPSNIVFPPISFRLIALPLTSWSICPLPHLFPISFHQFIHHLLSALLHHLLIINPSILTLLSSVIKLLRISHLPPTYLLMSNHLPERGECCSCHECTGYCFVDPSNNTISTVRFSMYHWIHGYHYINLVSSIVWP
jgi:hypothetical protein